MMPSNQPIGVVDSGLGGLTVLRELSVQFPSESFVYLGDTARLPYGNKSARTILQYLQQSARALLAHNIKALVVACNSASSVLDLFRIDNLPTYGVILPGARVAVQQSSSGRIGVIGTRATVAQRAYVKAIAKLDDKVQVFQQACPLFVPLVEEGWVQDPLTNLIVYRYLTPLMEQAIDTLILGCTHYPLLKPSISKVTGSHIQLVDSASAIAEEIRQDFSSGRIDKSAGSQPGRLDLLTTDHSPALQSLAHTILGGEFINSIQHVDLAPH